MEEGEEMKAILDNFKLGIQQGREKARQDAEEGPIRDAYMEGWKDRHRSRGWMTAERAWRMSKARRHIQYDGGGE